MNPKRYSCQLLSKYFFLKPNLMCSYYLHTATKSGSVLDFSEHFRNSVLKRRFFIRSSNLPVNHIFASISNRRFYCVEEKRRGRGYSQFGHERPKPDASQIWLGVCAFLSLLLYIGYSITESDWYDIWVYIFIIRDFLHSFAFGQNVIFDLDFFFILLRYEEKYLKDKFEVGAASIDAETSDGQSVDEDESSDDETEVGKSEKSAESKKKKKQRATFRDRKVFSEIHFITVVFLSF